MRKIGGSNKTIISMFLILLFFGIRMMLPNNGVIETEEINLVDFQSAMVTKVVDGDTIWVDIDGVAEKVRFIGIDTPEKNEEGFSQATDYTRKMLLGKVVLLEKDISNRDKYDRLLRYVWFDLPTDQSDSEKQLKLFNGMLVENGYAQIATYKPDVKYLDYYQQLVEQE